MPRTSKYTSELVEQMLRLIEAGAFAIDACIAVGIDEVTYYRWLRDPSKSQFCQSIKMARAKAINMRVLRISKAGQEGSWQADAWWLERVARKRFGRNPPQEQQQTRIVLGFEPKSAFINPVAAEGPSLPSGDRTRTWRNVIRPRKK
ncbi:MAG: hypothetical protein PHO54_06305 [Candidatus Peribacteraceae bacterium]|nr:hypothetical protein [Candidatus Peribacteraceae bacterium]